MEEIKQIGYGEISLETIFDNSSEFYIEYNNLVELINKFANKYKTNITSPIILENSLNEYAFIEQTYDKLYVYAYLIKDLNINDTKYMEDIYTLKQIKTEKLIHFEELLLNINEKELRKFIKENRNLNKYKKLLYKFKRKQHLDKESNDKLLQLEKEKNGQIKKYFAMYQHIIIDNSDIKELKKYEKQILDVYIAAIKYYVTNSYLNGFKSVKEYSLQNDGISIDDYNCLIQNVNNNLDLYHEYLNLDFIDSSNKVYDVKKVMEEIIDSLQIFGVNYINNLKKIFVDKCIDLFPKENKKDIGYEISVYGEKQYIFLNYNNTFQSGLELTHEIGHALNQKYINENQDYINSDFNELFIEIPSTVNEILLMHNLLEKSNYNDATILKNIIDRFAYYIFKQTEYAEFEDLVYETHLQNGSVNTSNLSNIMLNLESKYSNNKLDKNEKFSWMYQKHFFSHNYYVYKYSLNFIISNYIVYKLKNDSEYVHRYLRFLTFGHNIDNEKIFELLEINLQDKEIYDITFDIFKKLINKYKNIGSYNNSEITKNK